MEKQIRDIIGQHVGGTFEAKQKAVEEILLLFSVVGQSEQLVCPHCKGKGEYIDTHPERYGLKTCECQAN